MLNVCCTSKQKPQQKCLREELPFKNDITWKKIYKKKHASQLWCGLILLYVSVHYMPILYTFKCTHTRNEIDDAMHYNNVANISEHIVDYYFDECKLTCQEFWFGNLHLDGGKLRTSLKSRPECRTDTASNSIWEKNE